MKDNDMQKSKESLVDELNSLREKVAELEAVMEVQKLCEKEIPYRDIFNSARDAFLIFNSQGDIVEANPQACKMYGYQHKEIVKLSCRDIIHPDFLHIFKQFQEDIKTKGEFEAESVDVKNDGTLFHIEVRGTDIDYKGEKHLLGITRDVSERKKMETMLQSLASELSLTEERERRRIAVWLHDQIGQSLAISRIKLGSLRDSLSSADHCKAANEICALIEETIQSVRSLTFELSPPILYELGLEAALEWLTEKFQEQQGIEVEFENDMQAKPLGDDLRVLLFQAVRELLFNVSKHSQAQYAKVAIGTEDTGVMISVEDDGVGFALPQGKALWNKDKGFGLFSIQERLLPLGGEIEIETALGCGTSIRLRAPYQNTRRIESC